MQDKKDRLLDFVGRRLTQECADQLHIHLRDLLDGSKYQATTWYQQKYGALSSLREDQKKAVAELIDETVFASLHAFLDIFERDRYKEPTEYGRLSLVAVDETFKNIDIGEISDGLPGELYSQHGWIARFSKVNAS